MTGVARQAAGSTREQLSPSAGEWPRVPVGKVLAHVQAGFASGERAKDGVIQLRMNNVDTQGRVVWDSYLRVPACPETIDEYRLLHGDVVFNNTNSTALVGKSALFVGHAEPVVYSNHFTRLRAQRDALSPAYLSAWLNHEWQSGTFAKICNQWIGQSAVKADKLLSLSIPVPPLAEQERIADRLTEQLAAVERARQAARERLAAAKALPAAYLREVFDGPKDGGWETCTVGELVRAPIRTGISKPGRPESNKSCLTLSAVRGRTLLLEACKPTEVCDSEAEGNWLRPGCFYVVRGNGNRELVGRGAFAPDPLPRPILFPDLLFQLDLCEYVDPSFFWFLWSSTLVRRDIEERARTAAGIYKINTSNLKSLVLSLPPLPDQRRLSIELTKRFAAAEQLIEGLRAELASIEAMPAALLREAFQNGGRDGEA